MSLADRANQISRWITLGVFTLAVAALVLAPILALAWRIHPFPGFVIDSRLLVANYNGERWSGRLAGMDYLQRVSRIGGRPVSTLADFNQAISTLLVGQHIEIQTTLPDGTNRVFPDVTTGRFSWPDFLRLFGVPYAVGLAHLLIGIWIFYLRGQTWPGRAFATFCIWTSLSSGLLFDVMTTHITAALWTVAIAMGGSSLINLALLFPEEWQVIRRRPWLRFIPFLISTILAGWGLFTLSEAAAPWGHVQAWRVSYAYAALGIVILLGTMLYRYHVGASAVVRQQARLILWGSMLAFTPIGVWFSLRLAAIPVTFSPILFLPLLLVFPMSLGLAISRYRLWDMDSLINRTLVYIALTVTLALIYFTCVLVLHLIVDFFMAKGSDIVVIVSTLAIALLLNPIRGRIQRFVDGRFYRRHYNAAKTLVAFAGTLRHQLDLTHLIERIENAVWETLQPAHVLTWLRTPSGFSLYLFDIDTPTRLKAEIQPASVEVPTDAPLVNHLYHAGGAVELDPLELAGCPALQILKSAGAKVAVPLIAQGELLGWLSLGPRLSEQGYSTDDKALLTHLAVQAAPAVRLAQVVRQQQAIAQERERLNYEMRLARLIQQTLLPRQLPAQPGWEFAAHWQPARDVGGDFYDLAPLEDNRLLLVIGDVSGKGTPAALVVATLRVILRGAARRLLSPGEALALANNLLQPELPASMFVTCLYTILDPASGRLQFANAGHNLPYRRADQKVSRIGYESSSIGQWCCATWDALTKRSRPAAWRWRSTWIWARRWRLRAPSRLWQSRISSWAATTNPWRCWTTCAKYWCRTDASATPCW